MARKRANPVRPVAVLDACLLIPPGLSDLLLSCAEAKAFRPVWQSEIEDEVRRNAIPLTMERRGFSEQQAAEGMEHTLTQMNRAFPDAHADTNLWVPLVRKMTCHDKDRHVLAVAVGAGATHLVTGNIRDFPVASRPRGLAVQKPDRFMLERFQGTPSWSSTPSRQWRGRGAPSRRRSRSHDS